MITESKREHRRRSMEAANENSTDSHSPTARKPKRRSWKLLTLLTILAAVVWLLPSIAVHTPLLSWAVKMATTPLNGSVTVGSASLGWLSPVAVQNVEIKDAEGKPVVTLPATGLNRSLWALAWDYSNLGKIRLENPKIDLVLRNDGSNVEDLLKKYLTPQEGPAKTSSTKIGLSVEIVDATVSVTDQQTGRSWQIQKLSAAFDMPQGPDGSMSATVSGDVIDSQPPGKLSASMKIDAGAGEVKCNTNGLPLAMFRALAERFSPGTTCDGRLAADLVASWGASGKNSLQGDLRAESLAVSSPLLKTDVLQFAQLHAACQASWQSDRIDIERSSLDCDVGNVSLTSSMQLPEKDGMSLNALLHQRHEISGQVDIARLARLLPATLRLREHVDIQSGQIQATLSSKSDPQGMIWQGRVSADKLTATASGRQIAWQQPISLVADVHETAAGPVVDQLKCESDFLKMHASGTPDALAASLTFNLKQLSDQLGQFVDLGSLQIEGEGWGNLNWSRDAQQQFTADTEIRLKNFQLGLPNQPAWREADLVTIFSAKGQTDLGSQTRIDTASLNVKSGGDDIKIRLTQPVQMQSLQSGTWPVRIEAQGDLENWPGRLAAWLPMQDCRLTGGYTLTLDGTASKNLIQLREMKLAAAPLVVASPWINMNEPKLDVSAVGAWDQTQRRLQIEPCSLNCATAALQGNNILLAMPEKGDMQLTGTIQYQGDAARIRQWLSDPAKPSTWQLAGQIRGNAQLRQSEGVIRGETNAEVVNLAVVDSTGQQFQEPRVQLVASGDYNNQSGVMQIDKFELASSALAAGAIGRVGPAAGVKNADINGQLGYDLERIAGLLRPYLGSGVRIVGRGSSPAWYRGPFSLATGQAAAGFRWDWANIYGLQIGSGELKAAMADGLVQIEPLDLVVSRGRMHLAPRVRLTPEPMEMTLPSGPLAQQIQIDPVMCASMLKYIAPVLADVASAQGSFSVDLGEGCRVPLGAPAQCELAGRFTIHSIEVGPGPLVRALATILGRESPAKLKQQSVVQFRMVGGRIYHQGLELEFPELTIRTYGSVGMDQTMAIMAEMPVPPKWIENNPTAAQALRGQTIQIPINGTLSKPQIDQRVLQDLTRRFMQRAAENMIEGEVNKQLDRLFGPRK